MKENNQRLEFHEKNEKADQKNVLSEEVGKKADETLETELKSGQEPNEIDQELFDQYKNNANQLLTKFFSFVTDKEEINPTLCGYYSNIFMHFIKFRPQ